MRSGLLIFIIVSVFAAACRNNTPATGMKKPGTEEMETLNRYLIEKDRERIQSYIDRKNLKMAESPTGLWYGIVKGGEGKPVKTSKRIIMEYEVSLLDGTVCYSSAKSGPMEIVMGRTKIESGLDEGLKMLKEGGEAFFIIPPLLAHGLPGDGKMIPPRSVVVYHIEISKAE